MPNKILLLLLLIGFSGCGVQNKTSEEAVSETPAAPAPDNAVPADADTSKGGDNNMKKEDPVDTRITWMDYEEGYNKAVRENKKLLVDVYTDWCGWCKVMDRETYTNAEVIKAVNTHFVTIKLNPEKARNYSFGKNTMTSEQLHAWLGYGRTFGYPTTYFVHNPGGAMERQSAAGYLPPTEFMEVLNQVIATKF